MLLNVLCVIGILFLICLGLCSIVFLFVFTRMAVNFKKENKRFNDEIAQNHKEFERNKKKIDQYRKEHFKDWFDENNRRYK